MRTFSQSQLTLIKQGFGDFTTPPLLLIFSFAKFLRAPFFRAPAIFLTVKLSQKSIALILHFRGLIFAILPADPKLFVFSVFVFVITKREPSNMLSSPIRIYIYSASLTRCKYSLNRGTVKSTSPYRAA